MASILTLITLFALTSLPSTEPTKKGLLPIAKPNCAVACGGTAIPYPFGTSPECYLHYTFWVTCNTTFNPPKLFMQDSAVEITEIALEGQLRILNYIAHDCHLSGGADNFAFPSIKLPTYLTVNNTANKFTIVGCDTYGFISGQRLDRNYMTGCTAICDSAADLTEGSCSGSGCCQTSIPNNVWDVGIELYSYLNYTYVSDFNRCGFGFLVEEASYNFSSENLRGLEQVERLPLLLDWAIGNGTCEEAERNSSSYGCLSGKSRCYKPRNGYGYRCACEDGYQGSAYINGGCQDIDECADNVHDCMAKAKCMNTIGNYTCYCPKGYSGDGRGPNGCVDIDECADPSLNDCTKKQYCTNTAGSYTCSCPKGYSGDGRGRHGCARKDIKTAYILIGVAFGTTLLLVAAIFYYMELKRRSTRRKRQKFFHDNGGFLLQEKLLTRERSPDTVKIFSSSELHKATNAFHNSMIVGQGGFGTVYKGELSNGTVVAIKKSKKVDPTQIEQFINEVFVLSQVNHRNVVRLLGCCLETEAPLLVYEFISNGTLSAHLHIKERARLINWETRLRIGAETAGVLAYLHSAASTPIIHRDVKSDNILLDEDYIAKVSDFGASKLVPLDLTQLSTMVQGTFGYLDPEYMQTSQLTEKSDVYSFGVVMLELLTGRKAVSFDKQDHEKNLANYFLYILKQNRLSEILDENIVAEGNRENISRVARVAKECLNVKGEHRPSMKEVAMELEGLMMGRKHSWDRDESVDEKKSMFDDDEELDVLDNGEGNGTKKVGFGSIWGNFISRFRLGR